MTAARLETLRCFNWHDGYLTHITLKLDRSMQVDMAQI